MATILVSLAELRRKNILAREPLEVAVLGGDKSESAPRNAGMMLSALKADLEAQAIFVDSTFRAWDMLDAVSTTRLINDWIGHCGACREHFVLIPNCSGFLHDKLPKAKERFAEIMRWADVRRSTVVWIEPQTKKAMGLWQGVLEMISKLARPFRAGTEPPVSLKSQARYTHPIRINDLVNFRLSLVNLDRTQ